jgi:hypothetical protein
VSDSDEEVSRPHLNELLEIETISTGESATSVGYSFRPEGVVRAGREAEAGLRRRRRSRMGPVTAGFAGRRLLPFGHDSN